MDSIHELLDKEDAQAADMTFINTGRRVGIINGQDIKRNTTIGQFNDENTILSDAAGDDNVTRTLGICIVEDVNQDLLQAKLDFTDPLLVEPMGTC